MPDIYAVAWKLLEKQIAKSRRQSISKADLMQWQLKALEQAVDEVSNRLVAEWTAEGRSGFQETPQAPQVQ